MSSLASYLPPSEGLLPKWLLFVRIAPKPQFSTQSNPLKRSQSSQSATAYPATSPSTAPKQSTPELPLLAQNLPQQPAPLKTSSQQVPSTPSPPGHLEPGPLSAVSCACTPRTTSPIRKFTRFVSGRTESLSRISLVSGWFLGARSGGRVWGRRWLLVRLLRFGC